MNYLSRSKSLALPILLLLVSLACNLPGLSGGASTSSTATQPNLEQSVEPQTTTLQATHAPTQVLPRPTRPAGMSNLPKPTIPAPPADATRQPVQSVPLNESQEPTQGSSGQTGSFYVVNNTSAMVICYFYMALSSDAEWGPDWLGEQSVINPGETFTLTGVPIGTYDAQLQDCDANLLAEAYGFDFPANDTFTLSDQ
jgi:hypothetical protein